MACCLYIFLHSEPSECEFLQTTFEGMSYKANDINLLAYEFTCSQVNTMMPTVLTHNARVRGHTVCCVRAM